jgi:hypothetical protein
VAVLSVVAGGEHSSSRESRAASRCRTDASSSPVSRAGSSRWSRELGVNRQTPQPLREQTRLHAAKSVQSVRGPVVEGVHTVVRPVPNQIEVAGPRTRRGASAARTELESARERSSRRSR